MVAKSKTSRKPHRMVSEVSRCAGRTAHRHLRQDKRLWRRIEPVATTIMTSTQATLTRSMSSRKMYSRYTATRASCTAMRAMEMSRSRVRRRRRWRKMSTGKTRMMENMTRDGMEMIMVSFIPASRASRIRGGLR